MSRRKNRMKITDWITLTGIVISGLGIGTIEADNWAPVFLIGIGMLLIVGAIKAEKRTGASRQQEERTERRKAA